MRSLSERSSSTRQTPRLPSPGIRRHERVQVEFIAVNLDPNVHSAQESLDDCREPVRPTWA